MIGEHDKNVSRPSFGLEVMAIIQWEYSAWTVVVSVLAIWIVAFLLLPRTHRVKKALRLLVIFLSVMALTALLLYLVVRMRS